MLIQFNEITFAAWVPKLGGASWSMSENPALLLESTSASALLSTPFADPSSAGLFRKSANFSAVTPARAKIRFWPFDPRHHESAFLHFQTTARAKPQKWGFDH